MGKVKEDLSLLLRKLDVEEQLKKAIKIAFEEILVVNHYVCMDVFDNIYIEEINKEFELDGDKKIRLKNDYEFFQVKFFSLCTKELSVTKARYIIFLFLNIKNDKNTYFSKKEYAEVICCLINDSNKYAYDEDYIYEKNTSIKIVHIRSVNDFVKEIIQNGVDKQSIYRGHSATEYLLKPSLFRIETIKNYQEYKRLLKEEFLRRTYTLPEVEKAAADDAKGMSFRLDCLMQHYGIPTNLLDFTTNPLVALFFACKDNPKRNGEVVCVSIDDSEWCYTPNENTNELITFVKPYYTNERVKNQFGVFAKFYVGSDDDFKGSITKIAAKREKKILIINSNKKKSILKELNLLGIDEGRLFPELEHISKDVISVVNNNLQL